jgi:hypothetical protein
MRQLAWLLSWAAVIAFGTACQAHATGATRPGAPPRSGVERSCVAADAEQPVALRLVVVGESGAPLTAAAVRITDASGTGTGAVVETDEKGEAEVGVRPGLWRVEVSLSGFGQRRELLELEAGKACTVRLQLKRAPDEFEF